MNPKMTMHPQDKKKNYKYTELRGKYQNENSLINLQNQEGTLREIPIGEFLIKRKKQKIKHIKGCQNIPDLVQAFTDVENSVLNPA